MGNGIVSSRRWQPDRQPTPQEQMTYWQNQAMQYKSERDQLTKTCERLSICLGTAEGRLARYALVFGFKVPAEDTETEGNAQFFRIVPKPLETTQKSTNEIPTKWAVPNHKTRQKPKLSFPGAFPKGLPIT